MKKILTVWLISLLTIGLTGRAYSQSGVTGGLIEETRVVYEKYGRYQLTPLHLTDRLFRIYLEAALLEELNRTLIQLYEYLSVLSKEGREKLNEAKKNALILTSLSKDLYSLSEKYYSAFSPDVPENLDSLGAEVVLVKKLAEDLAELSNKYKETTFVGGFGRCFQEMSLILEEFAKELTEIHSRYKF